MACTVLEVNGSHNWAQAPIVRSIHSERFQACAVWTPEGRSVAEPSHRSASRRDSSPFAWSAGGILGSPCWATVCRAMFLAMSQLLPDLLDCPPALAPGGGGADLRRANGRGLMAICCGSPDRNPSGISGLLPPGPPLAAPEPESPDRRPDSSSGSFGMLKPNGRSLTIRPQAGLGVVSTVTLAGSCPE